jgi:hypothetical protein
MGEHPNSPSFEEPRHALGQVLILEDSAAQRNLGNTMASRGLGDPLGQRIVKNAPR